MPSFKRLFAPKLAFSIFMIMSCLALIYHGFIVTQIIPYANVWGGRLPSLGAMYVFETFSIISQAIFILIATLKYKGVGSNRINSTLSVLLFCMAGLLALNTLGNIFSMSRFEAIIFTPLTLIGSICAFRLALV